jgi:hypothetical protein
MQGETGGEPESSGTSSGEWCPMEGCGEWVTDLRGHCVRAYIPAVFRDLGCTGGGYWEGQGVCIADDTESPWGIGVTYLGMWQGY